MTTYVYQNLGTSWAVGIRGDSEQEVKEHYFGFWNHGATGGDLQWLTSTFAYFWTTPEKLMAALLSMSRMSILRREDKRVDKTGEKFQYKGRKGGVEDLARAEADERFRQFTLDYFVVNEPTETPHFYIVQEVNEEELCFT
jgi:hypothetical protein